MTKPSKTQLQLVKAAAQSAAPIMTKAPVHDLPSKLIRLPNAEQAAAICAEQAALDFDATHPEYHQVSIEKDALQRRFKASEEVLEQLEDAVNATPPHVKTCSENSGTDKSKVNFSDWTQIDQCSSVLIALAFLAALVMSSVNVYSNLISSGEVVYIQQRWIPLFIGLLAPSCSIAVKFMSNIFDDNYRHKKRYTHIVFVATGLSFCGWMFLFAMTYASPTASFNVESIADGGKNNIGSWLAFVQLSTEILVGGALFLALQDIYLKYSPLYYRENIVYINAVKTRDAFLAKHNALRDARNKNHGRYAVLSTERKAYINNRLIEFIDLKARFNANNNF